MNLLGSLKEFGGHSVDFLKLALPLEKKGYTVLIAGGSTSSFQLTQEAFKLKTPLIIFYHNDFSEKIIVPTNTKVFRSSANTLEDHEELFPVCWVSIKDMNPQTKNNVPRVSFCGAYTHPVRKILIENLKKSIIKCDFIIRKKFWNGIQGDKKSHREFELNMESSEFALCPRGKGTFSIRFYEALKAGRIPVVTSDILLPMNKLINWNDIVVFVNANNVAEKIIEFWNSRDLIFCQEECKKVYSQYLEINSFVNFIN
jgi:hypothetical protein